MPNRIIRDWTDSDKIKLIDAYAERFFTRLIMKADDYGCYFADPKLLKANLFPFLLDEVREADISRWMTACQKAGLIVLYEFNLKKYLQILDFRQRLDRAKAKFPLPTSGNPISNTNDTPPEAEAEADTETEAEAAPLKTDFSDTGLTWDIKSDLLNNKIVFEKICCAAGKNIEIGLLSLSKYHLWLQGKEQYPKSKKALYASFQLWLGNEKSIPKIEVPKKSGPSARELEESENRKKLGM